MFIYFGYNRFVIIYHFLRFRLFFAVHSFICLLVLQLSLPLSSNCRILLLGSIYHLCRRAPRYAWFQVWRDLCSDVVSIVFLDDFIGFRVLMWGYSGTPLLIMPSQIPLLE